MQIIFGIIFVVCVSCFGMTLGVTIGEVRMANKVCNDRGYSQSTNIDGIRYCQNTSIDASMTEITVREILFKNK